MHPDHTAMTVALLTPRHQCWVPCMISWCSVAALLQRWLISTRSRDKLDQRQPPSPPLQSVVPPAVISKNKPDRELRFSRVQYKLRFWQSKQLSNTIVFLVCKCAFDKCRRRWKTAMSKSSLVVDLIYVLQWCDSINSNTATRSKPVSLQSVHTCAD